MRWSTWNISVLALVWASWESVAWVVKMVKVLAWDARGMGSNPSWSQFFQLKITDVWWIQFLIFTSARTPIINNRWCFHLHLVPVEALRWGTWNISVLALVWASQKSVAWVVKMVKVLAWHVRGMGSIPTWSQFFSAKNYRCLMNLIYYINICKNTYH